jgi:uncharacterized RDD family membrane protein YckC
MSKIEYRRAQHEGARPSATEDATAEAAAPSLDAPGLTRRLACFIYEGVLLFGVLMISGYLFSSLTQQRDALVGRHGLQAFLFIVLGIYFVWFWSHGGQTVAMKAWNIRLVDREGRPVSQWRAFTRYLLAWLWFIPALAILSAWDMHAPGEIFGVLLAGILGYAWSARLSPERQFLHDIVCGTRLITHHALQ